jgi:hypothetical protein
MIDFRIIESVNGESDLIETFTTLPESKKLFQVETGITYYNRVVDVIIDGKSKYSYEEVDKTQADLDRDAKLIKFKNYLGGTNK